MAPAAEPEAPPPRSAGRRALAWAGRLGLALASLAGADLAYGRLLPRLRREPFFHRTMDSLRFELRLSAARPFLRPGWDRPPPDRREARVGIFGGSVAYGLANYLNRPDVAVPATGELARRLGRPVRFLDLAVPGGYEPSQFNLLHLSAHQLDAAVFLDGFNEQTNDAPDCDRLATFWARTSLKPSEILRPLADSVASFARELDFAHAHWLDRSGLFRLRLFNRSVEMNRVAASFFVDLDGAPLREGVGPLGHAEQPNARWENCVRRANDFARARSLPIYFFVQPNQHVAGSKPFTPEERACCVELPPGTTDAVREMYESLTERYADFEERAARLRADGVPARTLTAVFRDNHETLYFDWCCHLNDRGNFLLAEALLGAIAAPPLAPPAPGAP